MSTDEKIERDYLRLRSFLKTVLGRLRTLRVIEGLILTVAGAAMVFLTGAFSLAVNSFLPYAPFVVSVISLLFFTFLLVFAAVRVIRVPSLSSMTGLSTFTKTDHRIEPTGPLRQGGHSRGPCLYWHLGPKPLLFGPFLEPPGASMGQLATASDLPGRHTQGGNLGQGQPISDHCVNLGQDPGGDEPEGVDREWAQSRHRNGWRRERPIPIHPAQGR